MITACDLFIVIFLAGLGAGVVDLWHVGLAGHPDLAPARACTGVIAAFAGPDLLDVCQPWRTSLATFPHHRSAAQPPLAIGRALWQGQPVAMVVAESRALAEDAVALITAEWKELEPIVDAEAALAAGAAPLHPELEGNLAIEHAINAGDVDEAVSQAHRSIRRQFRFSRHTGVPLETRTVVADFDPAARQLCVYQSTQVPHQMRAAYADIFDLAEIDVRVVTPDVGGGFGVKLHVYDDEMAAVAASVLLGRPVKLVCDRLEAFSSDVHARSHAVDATVMADEAGRILGFVVDNLVEIGAYSVYPRSSVLEGLQAMMLVGAPYSAPALRGRLRVAYQNKAPVGAYRGVGQPIACAITEQLVDALAAATGLDPVEIRRRNYRRTDERPAITPGGIDVEGLSHGACLEHLIALMDYPALRKMQREARERGRHIGIGFAAFVEMTAPGPGFYGAAKAKISAQDGCTVRLEPSGGLTCVSSSNDQGQGVETGIQQLVADVFGVAAGDVRVVCGDTLATPLGGGAFASRGLAVGGEAALTAAHRLRERLMKSAAAVLGVDFEALALADGVFSASGGRRLKLQDLAELLHYRTHQLPAGVPPESAATAQIVLSRSALVANGIQASLLEVDIDTGFVRLLKHWVVEDCGRIVNPLLVDEQLRGGVVQGIGAALFEECLYDGRGQLQTATLADYLVPMAAEMPDIVIGHVETPVQGTLLGGKGVGEAGTIGAGAAIANALNDALRPFGALVLRQPYTPERVLQALGKVP